MKIRTQLLIFFTVSMLVLLLIVLATYYQSVKIIDENNAQYISQSLYQISSELTSQCEIYEKMIQSIGFNQMTQDYIYNEKPMMQYDNITKLTNYLNGQKSINEAIIDICIIPKTGSSLDITGLKDVLKEDTQELTIGKIIYYSGNKKILINSKVTNCILVVSNIYTGSNRNDFGMQIGKVILVLDASKISKNVVNMNKMTGTEFYLIDVDGVIFSSNNKSRVGQRINDVLGEIPKEEFIFNSQIGKTEYKVYLQDFVKYNGTIISIVPMDKLLYKINIVRKVDLILVVISIIILGISLRLILKNIVNPLKKISAFMNEINSGNLKTLKKRISLKGHMEVEIMADNFNEMLDEINSLTHRMLETNSQLYELEITKKKSEMAFLQSQINPHFLYNTLESIKGIALYKKVPEIRDMAQCLADIFRYSIKGDELTTLETELDILKSYIKIQQIRFFERFDTTYKVSFETMSCIVPKMILQPIVENSIYHGIELDEKFSHLVISSRINNGNVLEIVIEDDGVGMDEAILQGINSLLHNPMGHQVKDDNGSIGIENVNSRIRLQYGSQYGLFFESKKDIGTKVIYNIPVKKVL